MSKVAMHSAAKSADLSSVSYPNSDPICQWNDSSPNALLILRDGTIIKAKGLGCPGAICGELCFNTAITGYQEILTDPSYLQQIVIFTFPHIGNTGVNEQDIEDLVTQKNLGAVGAIFRTDITTPSNYRATNHLNEWLKQRNIIALYDIDTRALTHHIRQNGALDAVIAYDPTSKFEAELSPENLKQKLESWPGLINQDLAIKASEKEAPLWQEGKWQNESQEYSTIAQISNIESAKQDSSKTEPSEDKLHIVAINYGIKRNILRLLYNLDAKITLVHASTSAEDILKLQPDGIFLSNGPGDPSATAEYAVPILQKLINYNIPIFGICLGHQLLALAIGANTIKMHQGHHGANHPVQDKLNGKVQIVSMNHGFAVDSTTLPKNAIETHISLFDKTNCGIALKDKPVFSVQHHPEASPGPQDSYYLFDEFKQKMLLYRNNKTESNI